MSPASSSEEGGRPLFTAYTIDQILSPSRRGCDLLSGEATQYQVLCASDPGYKIGATARARFQPQKSSASSEMC